MISRDEASELIFAGVLGCLDWADQSKLNEYIKSGGELPSNLGEYQNIAAMLPVILNPEIPDPKLKDKVARKLYRIKDELRAKAADESLIEAENFYKNSRRDRSSNEPDLSAETEKFKTEEKLNDSELKPDTGTPVKETEPVNIVEEKKELIKPEEFEPVTPLRNTFESFKSTREKVLEGNFEVPAVDKNPAGNEAVPEPKIPPREKIKTYERVITKDKIPQRTPTAESAYSKMVSTKDRNKNFEKAYKKKYPTVESPSGKKSVLYFWSAVIMFVILILALAVSYLNFSSAIKDLKSTNESLRQQVNDLSVKFSTTQEIQSFLESPDVKIVSLDGTGMNPGGKGKLIVSFSQNKGYLQLSNMPELGQDKTYQLWMQLPQNGYYSLGVFIPSGRVQYFPFNIPQSVMGNVNDFFVTEELSPGASVPGNKIFLRGSFR